uniref:Putative ovule protein n=1 Tax=Solanum chacoense TaxID=4108 RepID=A0A0V0GPE8_SOLCH
MESRGLNFKCQRSETDTHPLSMKTSQLLISMKCLIQKCSEKRFSNKYHCVNWSENLPHTVCRRYTCIMCD